MSRQGTRTTKEILRCVIEAMRTLQAHGAGDMKQIVRDYRTEFAAHGLLDAAKAAISVPVIPRQPSAFSRGAAALGSRLANVKKLVTRKKASESTL